MKNNEREQTNIRAVLVRPVKPFNGYLMLRILFYTLTMMASMVAAKLLFGRHLMSLAAIPGYFLGMPLWRWISQNLYRVIRLICDCPPCKCGKCTSYTDYETKPHSFFGYEEWFLWLYRCKCGGFYAFDGKKFSFISETGDCTPYLKLHRLRKWVPDESDRSE